MPIAIKFSEDFYDKFGHGPVDELVNFLNRIDSGYRSELQKLNDRNFRLFDAKLEQRIAELEAKLEQRIAELDARLELRAAQLESRLIRWTFAFWAPTMLAVVGLLVGSLVG
jgi:hypothetical protein